MKRIGIICVIVSLLCSVSFAREDGWKHKDFPKELVEQLQLTPTQAVQLQAQHESEQQSMAIKFAEIKKLHDSLDKELMSATPDEVQVQTIIQAIKKTQMETTAIHFEGLLKTRQILTPVQFKKMITMRKHFRDEMEKKFGEKIKRAMDSGFPKLPADAKSDHVPPPPPEGGMPF